MTMLIGYLEVVEVRKIRSRSVCQLIVEADISQFKNLVQLDDLKGVFIPCEIEGAVCGALEMDLDPDEIMALMSATKPTEGSVIEQKPKGKKSLAQKMVINGYFMNPKLWDAMEKVGAYSQDNHYLEVLAMDAINIYPKIAGKGDVVAHHVRTAANSGTGIKPKDWYCIPIHDSHHKHLHNNETREERQHHLELAVAITAREMRKRYKAWLGLESMSGFNVTQLVAAEIELGINTAFRASND